MSELCRICATPTTRFCTGCEQAHYCSVECQREDWPLHREDCEIGLRLPFRKNRRVERYAAALKMLGEHYFAEYTRWLRFSPTGEYMPNRQLDSDIRKLLMKATSTKYRFSIVNHFFSLWQALVEHIFSAVDEKPALESQIGYISKMLVDLWLSDSGFTFHKETTQRKERKIAAEWKTFLDTLLTYGGATTLQRDAIEARNGLLALRTAETIATGD